MGDRHWQGEDMSYETELAAIGVRADADLDEATRTLAERDVQISVLTAEIADLEAEIARLRGEQPTPEPEPEPEPPVTVLTAVAGDGQATLTWTEVPGATGYAVGRDGQDSGGSGPWATVDGAGVRSRVFLHLVNGQPYVLHCEPQGVTSPRQTVTVTPQTTTTPTNPDPGPVAPGLPARGWYSGVGTHEQGNGADPAKYFGDYRGAPVEVGVTWMNTTELWGINSSITNSWAGYGGAMILCMSHADPDWTTFGGYAGIAAGKADSFWRTCASTAKSRRAGKGQTYFAPFYEFNGDWMKYSVTRTAQGMADFRAAWARIAGIWRAEFPACRIILAPAQGRDLPDAMTPDLATFDLLGGTNYNAWPWTPSGDASMQRFEQYRLHAKRLGKPVGITEWANSGNAKEAGGGGEAPEYIRRVQAWFTANRGTGPGQIEVETFFNISGYALDHQIVRTNGQASLTQPLTAAAYRDVF